MKKTTNRMKKSARATKQKTVYVPISSNIYFDGHSYRVRVSFNGTRISQNFSSKRKATTFRNTIQSA
jgi:hypothetical protein